MHIYEEEELNFWHSKQEHGADGVWALRRGNRTLFTDDPNEIQAALVMEELRERTQSNEPDIMYWHHYSSGNSIPPACWFWYMPGRWYPGCKGIADG